RFLQDAELLQVGAGERALDSAAEKIGQGQPVELQVVEVEGPPRRIDEHAAAVIRGAPEAAPVGIGLRLLRWLVCAGGVELELPVIDIAFALPEEQAVIEC